MDTAQHLSVVHRRYISYGTAHYGGNLVDGAYGLALFGDAATHLSVILDGHEGLFAGYSSVDFLGPVHGGDVVEVEATLEQLGKRSRRIAFALRVLCRATGSQGQSTVLNEPIIATRAVGTIVIPAEASEP